jgi:hypothetical protein
MNKKGNKANLKAEHLGNTNAQKAGVYSSRRRAEEAERVREALAEDAEGFLAADQIEIYADLRARSKLLEDDLAERGVSDRKGEQRRQVGTYLKTVAACVELGQRLLAGIAAEKREKEEKIPWAKDECMELLCGIARDRSLSPAGRIAAMKFLSVLAPEGENSYDREFFDHLQTLPDDELERELKALSIPNITGAGISRSEWAEEKIRRMARLDDVTADHLRELYEAIAEELGLSSSSDPAAA